ncbi:cupin domain-containing protein [Ottowia thiooxydans]|uniref:Mannose-6-phosphate isomerase-like protein (Cupin superfamily) n=1 Tax=Ottowia thiooxydans TaxID=219182 RepID=A0ABV2QHG4_9BURK
MKLTLHMLDTPSPIRRILTGLDSNGRSIIESDGPSPAQKVVPERPGYRITDLWRTLPGDGLSAADSIAKHSGVLPPPGGTVVRIIEWPPEPQDPMELRRLMDATFKSMFPDAHRDVQSGEHPGMHQTNTIDYAIVLEGEVLAIMEEGETLMKAGDVLIQRGTSHAWANRSGKPVKVAFILVDTVR